MAAIKEYTSQETPGNPISSASEVGYTAGATMRNLGGALQTGGKAFADFQEHREISNGNVQASALHAKLSNEAEELKTSGKIVDPEEVVKFQQHVDDETSRLLDNVSSPTARLHLNELGQTIRSGFSTRLAIDHQQAYGIQANANLEASKNFLSNSAREDPSSIEELWKMADFMAAGSGVSQEQVPKLSNMIKKEIGKAAIDGMIQNGNAEGAQVMIAAGRFDDIWDSSEKQAQVHEIDAAVKGQRTIDNVAREEKARQAKAASDTKFHSYMSQIYDKDFDPQAWKKQIVSDPELEKSAAPELIRILNEDTAARRAQGTAERVSQERAATEADKTIGSAVMGRIMAPPGTPNRITDIKDIYAEVSNGLSVARANQLATSLNTVTASRLKKDGFAQQYAEFHKNLRQELTLGSPLLEGDYANAMSYAEPLIQKGLQAGLTAGQMFNKDSPDYVLKGYQAPKLSDQTVLPISNPAAKSFDRAALDKLPKGATGKEKGVAALYEAVQAKQVSPAEASQIATTHGWR